MSEQPVGSHDLISFKITALNILHNEYLATSLMVQKRIIPVLLLGKNGLVKTTRFDNARYIGDPINSVRIFNEKEVDELVVLDIEATARGSIQYDLIEQMAGEAFMPLAYGGGISNAEEVGRLLRLGVEKVIINSALQQNPALLNTLADKFGSSTILAAIDFRKNIWGTWKAFSHNGKKPIEADIIDLCIKYEQAGAGELLLNCISRDGTMEGYPVDILKRMSAAVNIPVIACGGAGSLSDMVTLSQDSSITAFGAGSLFIYHGPHKAVLINYPSQEILRNTFF